MLSTTELIENSGDGKHEFLRIELISPKAELFRTSILKLCNYFIDDSPEIASKLRFQGLIFNTSFQRPEQNLFQVCGIGDIKTVKNKWGADIAQECHSLTYAMSELQKSETLVQKQLVKVIEAEINSVGLQNIKIWCHSKERVLYMNFLSEHGFTLSEGNFISTVTEYKNTEIFGVLVIVGPLRHFGWSNIPRIILSSPKYNKLIQLVWRGLKNSPEFGLDPIIPNHNYMSALFDQNTQSIEEQDKIDFPPNNKFLDDIVAVDDLDLYSKMPRLKGEAVECILFDIGSDLGFLSAKGAEHLLFTPSDTSTPFTKELARIVEPEQFIVLYNAKVDLGLEEFNLPLAMMWKTALERMYSSQYRILISRMRESGINLKNLELAASHWKIYRDNIINAPQSREHFRKLINEVLSPNCLNGHSWHEAWKEIEDARQTARKDGRVAAEIIQDEVLVHLNSNASHFSDLAQSQNYFMYRMVDKSNIQGTVEFCQVANVSEGFKSPYEKLGVVDNIRNFEQFRSVI